MGESRYYYLLPGVRYGIVCTYCGFGSSYSYAGEWGYKQMSSTGLESKIFFSHFQSEEGGKR